MNPRLRTSGVPLVGHTLALEPVDFRAEDISHWAWFVETTKGNKITWGGISGQKLSIKVEEKFHHKRLRATVTLHGGVKVSKTTFPVLRPEEFSREIDLNGLARFSSALDAQLGIYQDLLGRVKSERDALRLEKNIDNDIAERKMLIEQIRMEKTELLAIERKLEAEKQRHRDAFDQLKKQLDAERTSLEERSRELDLREHRLKEDHDLQAKLTAASKLSQEVDEAWDLLDKANHLKVKLTPSSREAILSIVRSETEAAREILKRRFAQRSSSSRCQIHGGGGASTAFDWGQICPDCSK